MKRLSWGVVSALVLGGSAQAEVRPLGGEVSVHAGGWAGDRYFDDGLVTGLKLALNITRIFGVEATYDLVGTEGKGVEEGPDGSQTIHSMNLGGRLLLGTGEFLPHLTFGAGVVDAGETEFATHFGLGATYEIGHRIGARADLGAVFSEDAPGTAGYEHFQITAGVFYRFGGDADIDDDGIENQKDKCPTKPEDKDDFEDGDGCPEPDNDGDKILDADDKCPNDAEDMDEFQDEDGCPDLDRDGDGLGDEADKCPDAAEDKDGFEDTDGCPDPDNDGDKILDTADKCPMVPESPNGIADTDGCPEEDADKDGLLDPVDKCPAQAEDKNGFEDTDGCPDTVPDDLAAVLGIVADTRFSRDKDTMIKSRMRGLEAAVEAFKAHPTVKIRIVVMAGKRDDALALAASRAKAVKRYFAENGLAADRFVAEGAAQTPLPDDAPKGARAERVELRLVIAE